MKSGATTTFPRKKIPNNPIATHEARNPNHTETPQGRPRGCSHCWLPLGCFWVRYLHCWIALVQGTGRTEGNAEVKQLIVPAFTVVVGVAAASFFSCDSCLWRLGRQRGIGRYRTCDKNKAKPKVIFSQIGNQKNCNATCFCTHACMWQPH